MRAIVVPSLLAGLIMTALASIATAATFDAANGHAVRRASDLRAHAAATLNVNDRAKLHVVGGNDNTLIEEGSATGTLPGTARVTLDIGATTATSNFTFRLSVGSISGHGTAKIHEGSQYESFGGTATIRHGTGRYAHISGSGGFYGVLNRRNDNAEVQVIGKLHL
jgi:hypothetical protein